MSKHADINKHRLVATDAPQLPAVIKKTKDPWKRFSILERAAEFILDEYDRMLELQDNLLRRTPGKPLPDLRDATLGEYAIGQLERCRELLVQLDGEDFYDPPDDDDDDGRPILKSTVISRRLAYTMCGPGGPKTPEAFAEILLSHVCDEQISRVALESACRHIERTAKFVQTIAEVLKVIKHEQWEWRKRIGAIDGIEGLSERMQQKIRELQPVYEREQAEKQRDVARHNFWYRDSVLKRALESAAEKQDLAKRAHEQVEAAMVEVAKRELEFELAKAKLSEAADALDEQTNHVGAARDRGRR